MCAVICDRVTSASTRVASAFRRKATAGRAGIGLRLRTGDDGGTEQERRGLASHVHRRHPDGRHSLPPRQRRVREEVPAGDDGFGRRVLRRRRRRRAGPAARQLDDLAGPAGEAVAARALPEQSRRHVHRRHRRVRSRRADLRHGRGRRRLRQRRQDRPLHHRARPQPPVPQPRRLALRGRDRRGRRRQRRVLDERRLVRLRPRRPARSLRRALRRLGNREGPVLHARRQDASRTARRSRTRDRVPRSSAIAATARSRTSRRRPASSIRPPRRSASRCSTTTATAGSICSSPTTRSRTGSTRTSRTARSPTSASRPAWRSTRPASRAPAWAWMRPTTTAPGARA